MKDLAFQADCPLTRPVLAMHADQHILPAGLAFSLPTT